MKISSFTNTKDTSCTTSTDVDEFINDVKYGKYKDAVEKIRLVEDKKERSKLKQLSIPMVSVSGLFSARKEDALVEHSGFISIDIDDQESSLGIENDPYTYACGRSVSGNGWFVIVKINPNKHKQSFDWLASYYYSTYGVSVDTKPKNVVSARFYSYDPNIKINKKSLKSKFKTQEELKLKPKTILLTLGNDDFSKMVNQVIEIGVDLTSDYGDWLNIGFALASEFNEAGREHFHTLSSMNANYKPKEANKQYDECLKERKSGITIGTLYWLMQGCGVEFPKVEREPLLFANTQLKKGMKKEDIKEGIKELYGKTEDQAETIIKSSKEMNLTDLGETQGEVLATLFDWLIMNYDLKRNEITRKISAKDEILTDEYLRTICFEAKKAFSNQYVNSREVTEIVFSRSIPVYNPVKDFFEKYKDRETNGELQAMIDCVKAKDDLHKEVYIRLWLVGIIAAAMEGHAMRTVLSFMSKQSTGKTYWFKNLFPDELMPFVASSKLNKGKDDELLMTEKLMIYKDENTGSSQEATDSFKELCSSTEFDIRAPYGRMNLTYKRLAVIGLTSNWFDIMNDPTGNTRLLPIEVLSIDFEMQNNVDRISLFVEMYREWESGAPYELNTEQVKHLVAFSQDYEEVDPAKELLEKYFSVPTEDEYKGGDSWVVNMTLTDMRIHITNMTNERINKKNFNLYVNEMFKDQEYKNRHTEHGPRKSFRVVKKQTSEELKWSKQ